MHPKYQEVINLRMKGKGYRVIAKTVGVSKNSVSRWCKDLELSPVAQRIIEEKIKHLKDKFTAYNRRKHRFVEAENKEIRKNAANQIHSLSQYELLLIGATLYWAEGWKRETQGKPHGICFVNSDPEMIRLFLRFLREIINVPEERIKVNIRIHPNISTQSAIKFWSKITEIPKEHFHITTQISRASKRKRPRTSLPYGTLKIDVSDRQKFQQIKGWIDGLIRQI